MVDETVAAGPGAPQPRTSPGWSVLAIVAFVLAFAVPPGAIVCGHIALGQIRRTGEQGRELALAGTVLGYVFTAIIALFVLLWIGVMAAMLAGWIAFLPLFLQR